MDGVHLFGVFDGHGGKEVALLVKEIYVDVLMALPEFKRGDFETALVKSFLTMDQIMVEERGKKILQKYAATDTQPTNPLFSAEKNLDSIADGIGCTAVVALVTKTQVIVANAGDSRAVICEKG